MNFLPNNQCKLCDLHTTAKNPGIPTRLHTGESHTQKRTAVLVVGEAPGYSEDKEGTSWVGFAGKLLTQFIDLFKLNDLSDVYLSNAVRCHPPQNADPTAGQVNICRTNLQNDLNTLCSEYPDVVILCTGRWGVTAVTRHSSLTHMFSLQGHTLDSLGTGKKATGLTTPEEHKPIPVFYTYHTAILSPSRKQTGKLPAMHAHFTLLRRYLTGEFTPAGVTVTPIVGVPVPSELPDIVGLDIETYGILDGQDQTVFHPKKSLYIDKVPIDKQIVSVSFGHYDESSPTGVKTYYYSWADHQPLIRQWVRQIANSGTTLIGQNIKFDVGFLKANDSRLNWMLSPTRIKLDDTLLLSFLLYEQRPERGLKELATLFGLADYSQLLVTGATGTAKGSYDPHLIYYNALDVAVTLKLREYCLTQIKKIYGANSAKLGPVCARMRNDVLWASIGLEQSGVAFNLDKLRKIDKIHKDHITTAMATASSLDNHFGFPLLFKGTGSDKSTLRLIKTLLEKYGLENDNRLKLTEKKKEVSTSKDNVNLLMGVAIDPEDIAVLEAYQTYQDSSKMVDTYTNNLLHPSKKGLIHTVHDRPNIGIMYPMWYPIPLYENKSSTDNSGGTIQGRFSCKQPPTQTDPSEIKSCMTTRFVGGKLIGYDLSQIELKVLAFMSGDPIMLREYQNDIDRHTETALLIFPDADPKGPTFRKRERQGGKTLNFLMAYRGGALKFQETLMKDFGIHLELEVCQAAIDRTNARYAQSRQWQDTLIETVRRKGYLELPTGWSRTWGTGESMSHSVSEICDFPIQTIAAQLMQSAQAAIYGDMIDLCLKSVLCLQIHDSIYIDCAPNEEKIIDKIVDKHLTSPPLLGILIEQLMRTIPITYAKEVITE